MPLLKMQRLILRLGRMRGNKIESNIRKGERPLTVLEVCRADNSGINWGIGSFFMSEEVPMAFFMLKNRGIKDRGIVNKC